MAKFNALVLAAATGALLGTAFRPGIPEIVILAGILVAGMALYRRASAHRVGKAA